MCGLCRLPINIRVDQTDAVMGTLLDIASHDLHWHNLIAEPAMQVLLSALITNKQFAVETLSRLFAAEVNQSVLRMSGIITVCWCVIACRVTQGLVQSRSRGGEGAYSA